VKTVDRQLSEYGEYRSERQSPITADELAARTTTQPFTRNALGRGSLVAAAAAVFVLVVGVLTVLLVSGDRVDPADTATTPTGLAPTTVSPPSTTAPLPDVAPTTVVQPVETPSTTLLPDPVEPAAPITGMAWQQITPDGIDSIGRGTTVLVSGGDRFLYVDSANKAVHSSFDGLEWTSVPIEGSIDRMFYFVAWHDTVVGTGCGGATSSGGPITPNAGCVSVIHPDGTVATQSFDAQINEAGIGPAGIVAIVTDSYDEDGLQYAYEDVVAWNLTGRDINEFSVFEVIDGVLHVESHDGQVGDYVLAEHGYADIESQVASGWFSQDGEDWLPIPDFPAGRDWDLIGTEDGFVAISDDRDGDVVAWHSSNGLDWRELGQSPGGGLSRWRDGAVVVATESVWHVSGLGIEKTPLATTGLGEYFLSTSGNVGVLVVDFKPATELNQILGVELNQILYSPNGQAWTTTNVPLEMRDLELTISADHNPVEAVATDTNVILLLLEAIEGDNAALVWYLGTPITD